MNDADFSDIVAQYMTDEDKYEIECLSTKDAIEKFKEVFGKERWQDIAGENY